MNEQNGYPSDFVSNEEKATKKYGLDYAKAMYQEYQMHGANLFSRAKQRYKENQRYRMGTQDNSKYKKHFEYLKSVLGNNKTLLNLDFEIVSPLPQIIDVIIGSLEKRGLNVTCKATDPEADNERMKYMEETRAFMGLVEEGWIQSFREAIGAPMPDISKLPKDEEELEAKMTYDFKTPYEIMAETGIDMVFQMNEFMEEFKRVIDDLATTTLGGTRTYLDSKGRVVTKRVDPKRAIVDYTNDNKFGNIRHCGEILDMQASTLRELAGQEISEDELRQVIEQYGSSAMSQSSQGFSQGSLNSYYENGKPYDAFTVKVMYFCFKRNNKKVWRKKDTKLGGKMLRPADYGYKPSGKNKREEIDYTVYYEGFWIVGTDHIFKYKLGENMATKPGSISECVLPFQFYGIGMVDGDSKSIVERAKPLVDDYMIYRLKLMAAVLKSPPPGFVVSPEAIANVMKGDGEYFEPIEVIELYMGTGVALAASRNDAGEYVGDSFKELRGGLPPEVMQYTELLSNKIREIEGICGTQQVQSIAPERQSVTATKLSVATNSNAIQAIVAGSEFLARKTGERILSILQLMVQDGTIRKYVNGIGSSNGKMAELTADIRMHDFGIFTEFEPDENEWMLLEQAMLKQLELRETGGKPGLDMEDYLYIKGIRNVKRAAMEFRRRLDARKREAQEQEQRMEQMRSQTGQEQIQAAAQAEIEKTKAIKEIEEQYAVAEFERKKELLQMQLDLAAQQAIQVQSQKYEMEYMRDDMKEGEKRETELEKIRAKGEEDRKTKEMDNESKERIAARNAQKATATNYQ